VRDGSFQKIYETLVATVSVPTECGLYRKVGIKNVNEDTDMGEDTWLQIRTSREIFRRLEFQLTLTQFQ
jgi:hypothetical protein